MASGGIVHERRGEVEEGPWRIVQKKKMVRKMAQGRKNNTLVNVNGGVNTGGSLILILGNEDQTDIYDHNANNEKYFLNVVNEKAENIAPYIPNIEAVLNDTTGGRNEDIEAIEKGRLNREDIIDSLMYLGIGGGARNAETVTQSQRNGIRKQKLNAKIKTWWHITEGER